MPALNQELPDPGGRFETRRGLVQFNPCMSTAASIYEPDLWKGLKQFDTMSLYEVDNFAGDQTELPALSSNEVDLHRHSI